MRVSWLTDIHLNFLETDTALDQFLESVLEDAPDVILLSGDIGESYSLLGYLERIQQRLRKPIYFVLGNHDYYRGAIRTVRTAIREFVEESSWLTWLPDAGVVPLTPDVALVGHGAWADGRCGDYDNSTVLLNDYLLIEEFAGLSRRGRLDRLHALGDEAADYFRAVLPQALAHYQRVILLTHVPPFRETCWHEGAISDEEFLPHFVCQAVGEALREVMAKYPAGELLVLCGHTHGEGQVEIAPNLHVLTGGAAYGTPEVQRVFELADASPAAPAPETLAPDPSAGPDGESALAAADEAAPLAERTLPPVISEETEDPAAP